MILHRTTAAGYAVILVVDGTIMYVAKANPGSSASDPVWQVIKVDETSGMIITFADGDDAFNNLATDLPSLVYS